MLTINKSGRIETRSAKSAKFDDVFTVLIKSVKFESSVGSNATKIKIEITTANILYMILVEPSELDIIK